MFLFDLTGKVAIVTGSSRGIGMAIAMRLAEQSACVAISSRKLDACEARRASNVLVWLDVRQMSSSSCQIFVPVDMYFRPSRSAADAAVAMLWAMSPVTDEIEATFSDELHFEDNGGNWSGVGCPACKTELEDWFFPTMTERWRSGFADLAVITPCCATPTTLDALDFGDPVAFCRFSLSMLNSRLRITDDQIAQLANCLGCRLKVIWRRI